MNKIVFLCIAGASVLTQLRSPAEVIVTGGGTNTSVSPTRNFSAASRAALAAARQEPIFGFSPAAPGERQNVIVTGPLDGFHGFGGFGGFGSGFPAGFILSVDTNFFAVFTNQFGTNVVLLPFAGTNLAGFGGRVPLGPLAPQIPLGAATNSVPLPAPAVPPQTPSVNFPPPVLNPVVPQPGGLPPTTTPFPPTGRPLAPPTTPGVGAPPTPSQTPVQPNTTPVPPPGTPTPK